LEAAFLAAIPVLHRGVRTSIGTDASEIERGVDPL
jgi:hypothetical protein